MTLPIWGTCSAGGGDGGLNSGRDLAGIGLLGQIGKQHRELEFFAVGEILAPARFELRDGITPLLGEFFDDRRDLDVIKRDSLVDLALLDGSKQQAQR